jgi:hypothetical protein
VVDVRMGQQDSRNRRRVHRKRCPIAPAQLAQPLELSAIDEDAAPINFEKVFRAGDGACSAKKGERGHPPALY